ncbi:unnamed protein product [Ilex paraguariensis]|uniref:Uncharacterized protein n=1 Tax=Ilex paraguariensis TaxID=185542 RepID=A0ABC8RGE1_9AQUA
MPQNSCCVKDFEGMDELLISCPPRHRFFFLLLSLCFKGWEGSKERGFIEKIFEVVSSMEKNGDPRGISMGQEVIHGRVEVAEGAGGFKAHTRRAHGEAGEL